MKGLNGPWYRREGLALLTDYYQLTMMAGHLKEGRAQERVCFEYFFRNLPPDSGFAVAAGLGPFLDYMENLSFEDDDIEYLRSLNTFSEDFLENLSTFRPHCTVRAVPEGTLVFPHDPFVQIEGPLFEAQLLETAVLNFFNFQTLIATKSARVSLAAEGEMVIEFGLRRAHGPDGGLSGSRAAYIGGCTSTSNVLAGKVYDIPLSGTHAHSWVMSYPSELEAFRAFARLYPTNTVLLVDTYDTVESGIPNAITVFREMRAAGHDIRPAIRLDSGDLAKLSKVAYSMMREAGFDDPLIIASNDLKEDLIADLKRQGAKINAWGVGTHLITSHDCPALNGVYKLVAIQQDGEWKPRIKLSANIEKITDPGRKNAVRYYDAENRILGDVLYARGEDFPREGTITGRRQMQPYMTASISGATRAEELLTTVFDDGCRVGECLDIHKLRDRAQEQINSIPEEFKRLRNPEVYRVLLSDEIGKQKQHLTDEPMT